MSGSLSGGEYEFFSMSLIYILLPFPLSVFGLYLATLTGVIACAACVSFGPFSTFVLARTLGLNQPHS